MPLPRLADLDVDLGLAEEPAPDDPAAFLRIDRLRVRLGGSDPFTYDVVTRRAMDAVVIAAHFERENQTHVVLVSAMRPPLRWRKLNRGVLWELPAGLVEPSESFRSAAARELFEETGAKVAEDALQSLGPDVFPAAGMIAEVHGFFHVAIDWDARETPPGDASALERTQEVASLPLDEALTLCARGELRDSKTELGLRRLHDALAAQRGHTR